MTDQMQALSMTEEEVQQVLMQRNRQEEAQQRVRAERQEAGKNIDRENCEVWGCHGNWLDPYGVGGSSEVDYCKLVFVRSPKSGGWVHDQDLPPAIYTAFHKALPALWEQEENCRVKWDMLPDADRLVQKIMWRDAKAPGYAAAVARGIMNARSQSV